MLNRAINIESSKAGNQTVVVAGLPSRIVVNGGISGGVGPHGRMGATPRWYKHCIFIFVDLVQGNGDIIAYHWGTWPHRPEGLWSG